MRLSSAGSSAAKLRKSRDGREESNRSGPGCAGLRCDHQARVDPRIERAAAGTRFLHCRGIASPLDQKSQLKSDCIRDGDRRREESRRVYWIRKSASKVKQIKQPMKRPGARNQGGRWWLRRRKAGRSRQGACLRGVPWRWLVRGRRYRVPFRREERR